MFLLLDCAASAPYIELNLTSSYGIFFSGHKFLGGQCCPGVLIVSEPLLEIEHPYEPGGGCVSKADSSCVVYKKDPEMREMGGTPNIIGIIRLGYVLMIKNAISDTIHKNETIISKFATQRMRDLETKYQGFKVIGLNDREPEDLPIFPVTIKNLHYNFITVLFNDLFGIQTRGGISCCGTFGKLCKNNLDLDGWCRVSFCYLHTKDQVIKIMEALEYIIVNGHNYMERYRHDPEANLFYLK